MEKLSKKVKLLVELYYLVIEQRSYERGCFYWIDMDKRIGKLLKKLKKL